MIVQNVINEIYFMDVGKSNEFNIVDKLWIFVTVRLVFGDILEQTV